MSHFMMIHCLTLWVVLLQCALAFTDDKAEIQLQARAIDPTTIEISWTSPITIVVKEWILMVSTTNLRKNVDVFSKLPSSTRTHLVHNLKPETSYYVFLDCLSNIKNTYINYLAKPVQITTHSRSYSSVPPTPVITTQGSRVQVSDDRSKNTGRNEEKSMASKAAVPDGSRQSEDSTTATTPSKGVTNPNAKTLPQIRDTTEPLTSVWLSEKKKIADTLSEDEEERKKNSYTDSHETDSPKVSTKNSAVTSSDNIRQHTPSTTSLLRRILESSALPHSISKDASSSGFLPSTTTNRASVVASKQRQSMMKWVYISGAAGLAIIVVLSAISILFYVPRRKAKLAQLRRKPSQSDKLPHKVNEVADEEENNRESRYVALSEIPANQRIACSVISWGSEFDVLDGPSENIYNNERKSSSLTPKPHSVYNQNDNIQLSPACHTNSPYASTNQKDAIYANNTVLNLHKKM